MKRDQILKPAMISTLFSVLLLIAFTAIVSAVALVLSLIIVGYTKPALRQVYTCSLVSAILWLLGGRIVYLSLDRGVLLRALALLFAISTVSIVPFFLLRYQFRTTWMKTAGASFLWVVGSAFVTLMSIFFLAIVTQRAYVIPTNAMAPTINGVHRIGTCEHCGGEVVVSASADSRAGENVEGICSTCRKFGQGKDISNAKLGGDRILASPFLEHNRWDIVTYYPPSAPNVLYVHRIVGMPGESVLIKEGQLWINGSPQQPPPGLENLRYAGREEMSAEAGSDYGLEFGVGDQPCQLQMDECFVLGDNSTRSMDSRFFGPVKMDQVTSVVTMRYWPPSRMKVLRNSSQSQR